MSHILSKCSNYQWYSLLYEAQHKSQITLNPEIESYLMFLLKQYINKPEITEILAGLELLKATQQKTLQEQDQCLRETGDKCLILAGLFPDYARQKQVNLEYFIHIGQSAYFYLSISQSKELRSLFNNLSSNFVNITDVLNSINEIKQEKIEANLLINQNKHKAKRKNIYKAAQNINLDNQTNDTAGLNGIILMQEKYVLH